MEIIKVLAAAPSESVEDIRNILDCGHISCVGAVDTGNGYPEAEAALPFDAVLMYSHDFGSGDREFLERLYMERKDTAFVLVCDEITESILSGAMHCGATRVLASSMEPDAICAALQEETERCASRRSMKGGYDSKVVAFFSPKGGCGTTTLALNTAVFLASHGKKTVLVDADFQTGDAASMMNLTKFTSFAELEGGGRITPQSVRQHITSTQYGTDVMIGRRTPCTAPGMNGAAFESVLICLKAEYDFVIVDLPALYNGCFLGTAKICDTFYCIETPELSSITNGRECLELLAGIGVRCLKTVINRQTEYGVSVRESAAATGREPCAVLPVSRSEALQSANLGIPVTVMYPDCRLSRAMVRFAENEFGLERRKNSFLRKLRGTYGT